MEVPTTLSIRGPEQLGIGWVRSLRLWSGAAVLVVTITGIVGVPRFAWAVEFPVGDLHHPYIVDPPVFCDPKLGCSKSFPAALTIQVDANGKSGLLTWIGREAKRVLFPEPVYPPFTVRVVYASASTDLSGNGPYADPRTLWYDIFYGYYEIEVRRSEWKRPFAFESARGTDVHFEDIVRMGKADWNYFSNHLYGVPKDTVKNFDTIDMKQVVTQQLPPIEIGGRHWEEIDISGVTVVSPYEAASGEKLETVNPVLTPLWRSAFGTHEPVEGFETSFFGTPIRAHAYLCFDDSQPDRYTTVIFGGTIREDFPDNAENARFLELQLAALRRIMQNPKTKRCAALFENRVPKDSGSEGAAVPHRM